MKSVRLEATKYIWTAFAVVLGILFGGPIFADIEIGAGQIVLGIVVAGATFLSTGAVWNWGTLKLEEEYMQSDSGQNRSQGEKAKRQHSLERLLDNMTDDELLDLREELRRSKYNSDGEFAR